MSARPRRGKSLPPEPPSAPGPVASLRATELWARAAYGLFVLFLATGLYLGSRPGGIGPIAVYRNAPWILFLLSLVVLVWAALASVRRRPVLRLARLRPLAAALVVFGAATYPLPYPTSHEGHPSGVRFRLPVEGEWTCLWGGDVRDRNRLARFLPDRRYGLHLVVARDGRTFQGDGLELADYHAYDRPVLAPADGTVAAVRDGLPDVAPRSGDGPRGEPLGNHLVLEVAEGEFVFLANLRAGSIPVRPGERVTSGAVVGRVGHSGFSPMTPEPHLSAHLQDTPEPRWGEAIPWRFHGFSADGRRVDSGVPNGGIGVRGELLGERVEALDG